jgi:hypothetical protein
MQRDRRPARRAELPRSEVLLLRGLPRAEVRARARDLYRAGWSLSSIAEAFDPPKARTSIRSWLTTSHPSLEHPLPSPASSASSSSTIDTAESFTSTSSTLSQHPAPARTQRDYRQVDSAASVISSSERSRIAELAPLARRYRAGTPRLGPLGVANDELTALARKLYDRGAPVRELAEAAGVTYRAMARRLGR